MNKRRIVVFILAAIAAIVLVLVFLPRRYESTFYPMGGIPFKVVVYGKNFIQFDKVMEPVETRVSDLEKIFSRYDKTSELSRLNGQAATEPFPTSPEMVRMIELSKEWSKVSGGAFDPTVGYLLNIWEGVGKLGVLPNRSDIDVGLSTVGMKDVVLMHKNNIFFPKTGTRLDFGAIAKGFIVDDVVSLIQSKGVKRGLVEAGGDAYVFGNGKFKIGIQDPFNKSSMLGTVEISKGAVVTSGDYERYVEIEGKKYSHIIDPKTGYPIDTGVISVTVVGGTAADADALATSVMVLGTEKGIDLAKRIGNVSLIIIVRTGDALKLLISKDLDKHVNLNSEWNPRKKIF